MPEMTSNLLKPDLPDKWGFPLVNSVSHQSTM